MEHCRQINLIADSSVHSTKDVLVTVAWSSEIRSGVHLPPASTEDRKCVSLGPVGRGDASSDCAEKETGKTGSIPTT